MPDAHGVIATHYRIDPQRPAPALAGGLRAWPVTDTRDASLRLLAVQTRLALPARPRITLADAGPPVPCTVLPMVYGTGRDLAGAPGWFVICEPLPGPAVGLARGPWREKTLIACVLMPAAAALLGLQGRGLTHRAINPDNLFQDGPNDPVTLGPFWAAPPASLQPAVYEPPYSARCLAGGRGDGTVADDVYALGVTLLALAIGRAPLAGLDDDTIVRRKLELGSYEALAGDLALPPMVGDLLRCMLAEDPAHRPPPKLLLTPDKARSRRVASRPARRAHQALDVGGRPVASARLLAHELGLNPSAAHTMLKTGVVEFWLRRGLGDPQAGMDIEEVLRKAAENRAPDELSQREMMVMQAVAALDPHAPLVWRGLAVQPDGVGGALATSGPEALPALEEMVNAEAVAAYLDIGSRHPDLAPLREEANQWRRALAQRGPSGGVRRLTYTLNPMLACASPLLAGQAVVRLPDLLPALEEAAGATDRKGPPLDLHIAAFIAARAEYSVSADLVSLRGFAGAGERLVVLRLFARLEARLQPGRLPGLAGWLLASGFAGVEDWRSHKRRAELEKALKKAAADGDIGAMLGLVDDPAGRAADEAGAKAAAARARRLKAALERAAHGSDRRAEAARDLGYDIATGAALIAVLGAVIRVAWH